jgi:type I restriction enzyme, S subunit
MVKENFIDVEPKYLALVKEILRRHIAYKTVWAYGSRVNWTANQFSDLDLVVFEVSTVKQGELKEDFVESDLPFSVDIILWGKIPENFKNKICEKYVVLQKKPVLEGWKECKLLDVAVNFAMGPFGSNIKADNFVESGVPVIRGKNLNYHRYVDGDYVFLSDEKADQLKSSVCLPGDLVFTHRGTIGQVGLIPEGKYPRYVVSQSGMKLSTKKDVLDNIFLFYFFKSNIGQHELLQNESQVGVPAISSPLTSLKSVNIFLPPLTEQQSIASVLSSLDDKIDLLHRQNKTLEAIAETLFRQWFVEEEQENWAVECLGNIADINPTYQLKKGEISTYVEMKNVSTSTFNPVGWYEREFTSGMKFRNGDTLLARITPCLENGKTCFVTFLDEEEIGWGSTEYIVIRMKEQFHPYISYIIAKDKDFRDFAISSMSGSSGRQRAQAGVIKEYDLKVPPLKIIEELNHQLDRILSTLKNNANQIRTLKELRDTLLPRLMSGEVRVKYGN